jgi:hypothetical protein
MIALLDWNALDGVTPKVLAGYGRDGDPRSCGAPAGLGITAQHDGDLPRRVRARLAAAGADASGTGHLLVPGGRTVVPGMARSITCGGSLSVLLDRRLVSSS